MVTLEDLPDEIKLNIMTYLSLVDRKNVQLLNRQWCNLAYSVRLTKDDIIVVNTIGDLAVCNANRKHLNIRVKNMCRNKGISHTHNLKFWVECGMNVRSIELYLFSFSCLSYLKEVCLNSPNLEYLLISRFDENDGSVALHFLNTKFGLFNLPKLISLDIIHFDPLNLEHLDYFLKGAPKLKRLSLEWLKCNMDHLTEPLRTFSSLHGTILKEINFSNSTIDSSSLNVILKGISSQLSGLYLRRCTMLDSGCISIIRTNFPNLKEIDLSYTKFSTDELCLLLEPLENLTHVSLVDTQTSITLLSSLILKSKLKALEISNCKLLKKLSWSHITVPAKLNLINLQLDKILLDYNDINIILKNAFDLKYLSLNSCSSIDDESLNLICSYCLKLRNLSLQNCTRLKNVSVANKLKGLIHFDLHGCRNISDVSISDLSFLELQTIDLSSTNATITSYNNILKKCPSIQDIYLGIEMEDEMKESKKVVQTNCKVHFGLAKFSSGQIFDN